MSDELVKRHVEQLRMTGGDLADLCRPLADAIEALTAQLAEDADARSLVDDRLLQLVAQVDALTAERDRLRETLTDAWDAHNKHGDQMSGWWVHDDALKGETP